MSYHNVLKCPECGSAEINQYRMPFGPMWCINCGFRIEDKNKVPNPFAETAKSATQQAAKPEDANQCDNQDSDEDNRSAG